LCIDEFVGKFSCLLILKFIKVFIDMEWVESVEIVLCYASAIIPTIFFCVLKNISAVGRVTSKNYSVFYNKMKVRIVNRFENVNVTGMGHHPNGITCST
jgi:uncharacterized membrane protein (UPF0182 family)